VATLPFVTAGHAGRDESEANHGTRSGSPADAGPGTLAGWGRRAVALVIDWVVANLIAFAIVRRPDVWQAPVDGLDFLPLAAFGLEVWLLTAFLGASLGHRVCGLVLVRLDGKQPPGLWRALIRTALLLLVIPVFVIGRDRRGLHDRVAGTELVRAR
jgi:uncharacterized RDD family membrane protein YckC